MESVRRPDHASVPLDPEEERTVSDVRVLLSAVLLAMGVSAAVSAGFMRYAGEDGPRIVTVRLAELTAEHVLQTAGVPGRALVPDAPLETGAAYDARKTRMWAVSLEMALDRVAARHGAVLLPARAVAAGAADVTGEVRTELTRLFQAPDSGGTQEVRP